MKLTVDGLFSKGSLSFQKTVKNECRGGVNSGKGCYSVRKVLSSSAFEYDEDLGQKNRALSDVSYRYGRLR